MGFAAEVAHCLYLCGETWRKGNKGATNDMLARSLEKQGWAALLRAARAAKREEHSFPCGSTQLIRAAMNNNLSRVLQLVQLGAPLEHKSKSYEGFTALHWACDFGHEHVARALLDGKYEGRGAEVDARSTNGWTPLMWTSYEGHEGVVRLLLARGARQELQASSNGRTGLHLAAQFNRAAVLALLCNAPGAAAALALRDMEGRTPLGVAIAGGHAACEAVLRARGSPE
jgi:ankyrin repeat protein